MTLYSDALAAYQAAQGNREGEARTVLAETLTPFDTTALTVADVRAEATFTRYVFTDGDVYLAVQLRDSGNDVQLVTGSLGNWTARGSVTSLASLGKLLPGIVAPPNPPAGPDPWAPGVAYAVGDQVTYDGKTYECIQAHTSQADWTPTAVPALWSVVA